MVKLVLFDVDGTLIHTRGAGIKAFEQTLASEFNIPNGVGGVHFGGRTDSSIVRELFQKHSVPAIPENFTRFFNCYVHWLDYLLSTSSGEICAGVWNFVHSLAALPNHPSIGLLTGNIRLGAEIKLRHFSLWEYFELGAFGDDDENRDTLAKIARKRGSAALGKELSGDEVVVVGDTPLDVQCAKAIGAKSLAVATGAATLQTLRDSGPTWAVTNLNEIALDEVCPVA